MSEGSRDPPPGQIRDLVIISTGQIMDLLRELQIQVQVNALARGTCKEACGASPRLHWPHHPTLAKAVPSRELFLITLLLISEEGL